MQPCDLTRAPTPTASLPLRGRQELDDRGEFPRVPARDGWPACTGRARGRREARHAEIPRRGTGQDRSFAMRSVMKPARKSRFDADLGTRPGTGQLCSSAQQLPELVRITSWRIFGSDPAPIPIVKASAAATIDTPARRLLQILATSPDRGDPRGRRSSPSDPGWGAPRQTRRDRPHHDRERPGHAPGTRPRRERRASGIPAASSRAPTLRVVAGSIVLMSDRDLARRAPRSTPPAARYRTSTSESGDHRHDDLRQAVASAADRAATAP
jgi:hypothetical protein